MRLILLIVLTSCTTLHAADLLSTLWFQDGTLELEVKRKYAYLYNEVDGRRNYYLAESKRYEPNAPEWTGKNKKKLLRFKHYDDLPKDVTVLGRNAKKIPYGRVSFSALRIRKGDDWWKVRQRKLRNGKREWAIGAVEERDVFAGAATLPKDLTKLKPNYHIPFGQDGIRVSWDDPETKLTTAVTSGITSQPDQRGFLDRNQLNGNQQQTMVQLYRTLSRQQLQERLEKREQLRTRSARIIAEVDLLRDFKGRLKKNRNQIMRSLDAIGLARMRLQDLEQMKGEKEDQLLSLQEMYLSNASGYAEYGLYVLQFRGTEAGMNTYFDQWLEKRATLDLGKQFAARTEKSLGKLVNRDLTNLDGGDLVVNSTSNDLIGIGDNHHLLVRNVKLLPNLQKANEDNLAPLPAKYQVTAILNEADFLAFSRVIREQKLPTSVEHAISKRLQEKFHFLQAQQTAASQYLLESFERNTRNLEADLTKINTEVNHLKDQTASEMDAIERYYQEARKAYLESQTIRAELAREEAEAAPAAGLFEFKLTAMESGQHPWANRAEHVSELALRALQSLDRRCELERETVKMMLLHSVFATAGPQPQLYKRYINLEVFNENATVREFKSGDHVVDYVVVTTKIKLEPDTPLRLRSYQNQVRELKQDWADIENYYKHRKETQHFKTMDSVGANAPTPDGSPQQILGGNEKRLARPTEKSNLEQEVVTTETRESKLDETGNCGNCYTIEGKRYNFRFLSDQNLEDDIYDEVVYGKKPWDLARERGWLLPEVTEVKAIIGFLRNNQNFPWDLRNKRIYVVGNSKSAGRLPVLQITKQFGYQQKWIYPGDTAYFIFKVKR